MACRILEQEKLAHGNVTQWSVQKDGTWWRKQNSIWDKAYDHEVIDEIRKVLLDRFNGTIYVTYTIGKVWIEVPRCPHSAQGETELEAYIEALVASDSPPPTASGEQK